MTEVTRILAKWVVDSKLDRIPAEVRKSGAASFLNWMGCAVGGSRHETLDRAIAALKPFSGPAQAPILGRKERFDILHAALLNGMSSHVFDFDDTHLKTIIHPAGPVASAVLPLAEYMPVTGAGLLHAFILGVEVECRIGNAVYPEHYDVGWHITGTAGIFGSTAASGRLLGLSERQMVWALGIAATSASGLRLQLGSMTKCHNLGNAARSGLHQRAASARICGPSSAMSRPSLRALTITSSATRLATAPAWMPCGWPMVPAPTP